MTEGPAFENSHDVYILGAGFSAMAGAPLIKDFLSRMRNAVSWLDGHNRQQEATCIKEALRFRLRAASAAHRVLIDPDNIEELFCLVSATDQGHDLARNMTVAIAATIDYAVKNPSLLSWLTKEVTLRESFEPPRTWKLTDKSTGKAGVKVYDAPLYDLIVGMLTGRLSHTTPESRTTYITFNYDTILEEALANLGCAFHYGLGASVNFTEGALCEKTGHPGNQSIGVYKIHGSMNWGEGEDGKLKVYGRYDARNEEKFPPLLIPPTWRKVFRPELGMVWDSAIRALATASRVIVIGFSLPPADVHFKYLLAAGLQDNISLRELTFVNPVFQRYSNSETDQDGDEVRQRIMKVIRPELVDREILRFEAGRTEDIIHGGRNAWLGKSRRPDIEY